MNATLNVAARARVPTPPIVIHAPTLKTDGSVSINALTTNTPTTKSADRVMRLVLAVEVRGIQLHLTVVSPVMVPSSTVRLKLNDVFEKMIRVLMVITTIGLVHKRKASSNR